MSIEALDRRILCAGNVTVYKRHGGLVVAGDDAANAITVVASPNGGMTITGVAKTTVNGGRTLTTDGVARPTYFQMNGGSDSLSVSGVTLTLGTSISLGDGNDVFYAKGGHFAATDINGDAGSDSIGVDGTTFEHRIQVFPGDGSDKISVVDTRASKGLTISDGGGNSRIQLIGVNASGLSVVNAGNSNDRETVQDSHFETFSSHLNGGSDSVVVRRTLFDNDSPIDGGAGDNVIERQVLRTWNFASGDTQGWQPGIANVPYDLAHPKPFSQLIADNDDTNEIANLPNSLQSAIHVAGTVDLQTLTSLFNFQELGVADGVEPGRTYAATITVAAYPYGFAAFSTFEINAVNQAPALTTISNGLGRLNVNRGISVNEERGKNQTSTLTTTVPVTADSSGNIWLMATGDLTGEVGQTVSYYLKNVVVEITPA